MLESWSERVLVVVVVALGVVCHGASAFTRKTDCPQPCVAIRECPELLSLIPRDIGTVQRATCGFQGASPVVCCPSSTNTNNGNTTPGPSPQNPLLPIFPNCGHLQEDRIHGGNITRLGAYPWMAALGYRNIFTNKIDFLCGGAVINNRYVLTAAHCFNKPVEVIRLAEWDLKSEIDCEISADDKEFCNYDSFEEFQPEELIKHPDYRKRGTVSDDIALIRLSRPITFSRFIQPVCLPDRLFDVPSVIGNQNATVIGWGFTENGTSSDILLEVDLPPVDLQSCNVTYKKQLVGNQLCFGGEKGKDSCQGDSGGPLLMTRSASPPFFIIGVVSFGPRLCGQPGFPGVYADVAKYRDWIDETLKP